MVRIVAKGLIVVAVLALVFVGLGVMGAFMVEEDSARVLLEYAVMVAVALVILWGGIRLLRRT